MQPNKHLLYSYFLIFSIGIVLMNACQRDQQPSQTLPTPSAVPAFLGWVFPQPSSVIDIEEFQKGWVASSRVQINNAICVQLNGEELLEANDNGLEANDYLNRIDLIIDGSPWEGDSPILVSDLLGSLEEVTTDSETGEVEIIRSNTIGPLTLCWPIKLDVGLHTIEFHARKTSGETLTYRWNFFISEQVSTN